MTIIKRFRSLPYVLLLGTLFGSNMVLARFSLRQMDSSVFNSLRLVIVTLCIIIFYATVRRQRIPRDRKLWLHGAIWGAIGLAIPMMTFISSLQFQSSGVTSLLVTLNVATTVLLAQVFLAEEPLNARKILGLVIAFAGVALILIRGETGLAQFTQADWRGYALVGIGVLGSSAGLIYASKYLQGGDQIDVISIRMLAAATLIIPFTLATTGFDFHRLAWSGVVALFVSAILGTIVTFLLEFYIIKRFSASTASQAAYVVPVVATVLGAFLLGEQVTPAILLGMGAVFGGISLLNGGAVGK